MCAGIGFNPEEATTDGFDVQMQTNHFSHFLLTMLLLPSLEAASSHSGDARVVNQSSNMRNIAADPLEAKYMEPLEEGVEKLGGDKGKSKRYQQSKLANSVFTLALKV